MHYHTHDIKLDNVPENSPVKRLWYASLLDLSLVEVEIIARRANGDAIPAPLLTAANNFKRDINAIAADGQAKLAVDQPTEAKQVTE